MAKIEIQNGLYSRYFWDMLPQINVPSDSSARDVLAQFENAGYRSDRLKLYAILPYLTDWDRDPTRRMVGSWKTYYCFALLNPSGDKCFVFSAPQELVTLEPKDIRQRLKLLVTEALGTFRARVNPQA